MSKHILIATLSVSSWNTKYRLGDEVAEANQAPLALLQLLPAEQLPDEVFILCTSKIYAKQFHQFKGLVESGNLKIKSSKLIKVSPISIPDGKNEEEIWEILKTILNSVPENSRLTLDLTHGFRSLPFLYFTAALYLKALHNVKIESVYYGIADASNGEYKPIIELSVILEMVEWFYATRIFKETGKADYIVGLLEPFAERPEGVEGSNCAPYDKISYLKGIFHQTSFAYQQALPIELGMVAKKLNIQLEKPLPAHLNKKMPLPDELFSQVKTYIAPFVLSSIKLKNKNKNQVFLDKEELLRQAKIIDSYFNQGYINNAIILIREWMVNVVFYHNSKARGTKKIVGEDWLKVNTKREPIENLMSSMVKLNDIVKKKGLLIEITEGQKWLAEKWENMTDKRNGISHCGFRVETSLLSEKDVEEIKSVWQDLKESVDCAEKWNVNLQYGHGTLLISSIGKTKGSLYSAITAVKPDYLFVLASEVSNNYINEVIDKAQWAGDRKRNLQVYIMKDPYAGFMESNKVIEEAEKLIAMAEKVVFNLTGGT
ncbi:MAG: TIGR02221 family CRISPR-associated protein, partial [Thermoanaerobacteraceae bacterium]|nr:TIGR02221 family CRISPR-associated protein [Thermoanaerobacteraceae bacterium]